jgi:hypothetical protein
MKKDRLEFPDDFFLQSARMYSRHYIKNIILHEYK